MPQRLIAALAMTIRLLYPSDPFSPKLPDEVYAAEFQAAKDQGIACSVFPLEALSATRLRAIPAVEKGESVIYRGWMLEADQYEMLHSAIEVSGGIPLTSLEDYLSAHHLPNWYHLFAPHTAETVVVPAKDQIEKVAESLCWDGYFVKDFVKSLTTSRGSIARSPEEAREIADQIEKYRGKIEGGVCLRRLEYFKVGTERRYFVFKGNAFGAFGVVPDTVSTIAAAFRVPFFSIDVAENEAGQIRLVEIGDGQVSDIKEWAPEVFVKMFAGHG